MQKSRTGSLNYVGNKQQMLLDIKESLKHLHVDQNVTRSGTLNNLVVDSPPVAVVAPNIIPPSQPALSRRSGATRFVNHQKQLDEISKSLAPHKDAGLPNGLGDGNYPNEVHMVQVSCRLDVTVGICYICSFMKGLLHP